MEIYVLDYMTLEVKDIFKPLKNNDGSEQYEINLDEETNATSEIMLEYKESIKKGNFLVINGLYKQFLFIISGVERYIKGKTVKVILKDISNMFDNKIIEDPIGDLSIENYIKRNIERNYMNTEDTLNNLSYLQIETKTQTKVTVNTDAEDGLFNLHTYITNCRQYKNIRTDFEFKNNKLYIYIEKKTNKLQKIDTNVVEIIDIETTDEEDYITKVEVYVRYNKTRYYLYLRNDRTTTENPKDPNRLRGKTEVISSETLTTAKEEALNTIRKNRYKHLIEFKIKKNSKLLDVNNLEIGDEVQVRVENKNYQSYISAITIKDNEFVYFKTGNLRNRLTDKLNQQDKKIGNKLDITGGDITGNLTLGGSTVITARNIKATINHQDNIKSMVTILNTNGTKKEIRMGNDKPQFHALKNYQVSKGTAFALTSDGKIRAKRDLSALISFSAYVEHVVPEGTTPVAAEAIIIRERLYPGETNPRRENTVKDYINNNGTYKVLHGGPTAIILKEGDLLYMLIGKVDTTGQGYLRVRRLV